MISLLRNCRAGKNSIFDSSIPRPAMVSEHSPDYLAEPV
jgi:hypothetical protein